MAINRQWSPNEIKLQRCLNFNCGSLNVHNVIVTGPKTFLHDGNCGNAAGCFDYDTCQHKFDSQ